DRRRPCPQARRPQRQPGRRRERLRATRRHPPRPQHRRHRGHLHARLRRRHLPPRQQHPPRVHPPCPRVTTSLRPGVACFGARPDNAGFRPVTISERVPASSPRAAVPRHGLVLAPPPPLRRVFHDRG